MCVVVSEHSNTRSISVIAATAARKNTIKTQKQWTRSELLHNEPCYYIFLKMKMCQVHFVIIFYKCNNLFHTFVTLWGRSRHVLWNMGHVLKSSLSKLVWKLKEQNAGVWMTSRVEDSMTFNDIPHFSCWRHCVCNKCVINRSLRLTLDLSSTKTAHLTFSQN